MNKKILKAALAGTAVVALAAGGSTWSSWSDWSTVTGSHAGADQLALTITHPGTQSFDNMKLAPGVGADFEFVVANRTGTTIPLADLSMQLTNLVGHEDGCTSTNSEAAVDPNCSDTTSAGEFIYDGRLNINVSQPTTDPAACDSSHPRGQLIAPTPLADLYYGTPVAIDSLAPGEYICVAMGLTMPTSATNASQGDSASFDLKFMLDQHL